MTTRSEILDFIGIGIGPANLSLAALSQPIPALTSRFYEKAREFAWHPGLHFPESFIQTSYLKDLVTPVAPTSRYSFLSFLVEHKRFYSFLTASFPRVSRAEFNQYLAWVSRSLPNLEFDCPVLEIDYQDDFWQVTTRTGVVRACDLVLGTGLRPHVPQFARPFVGRSLHHAIHFNHHQPELAGQRVAVIGGGQSGAELVHHCLLDSKTLPSELLWVSRREGVPPLDDSPFANELFTPEYSDHFYRLDEREQRRLLDQQTLASDGASMSLLQDIYRRLYALQFVEGRRPVQLLPGHDLVGVTRSGAGWLIEIRSRRGHVVAEHVDVVILATGHRYELPDYLAPMEARIDRKGDQISVREDFSVVWDGPEQRRLFLQNGARHQRGVADPNLSLLAWRSASIVNRLAGRDVYDCTPAESIVNWAEHRNHAHTADYGARASA
jgi:lysine N6-hydroxylase